MAIPPSRPRRTVDYDAGDLGCASGLPQEVRRRLQALAPGERLVVTARDPAAREDLPALARLMGHVVEEVGSDAGRARIVIRKDVGP